ncbi:cupredoxin domain-containing protein [Flavobacteriaceae bacterium]|nr:cupredoxin domain-containing protein [Flavobacteriaceae bacterium]
MKYFTPLLSLFFSFNIVFSNVIDKSFSTNYTINVTASSSADYTLSGTDFNGAVSGNDPNLTFYVGDQITFAVNASNHPFYIKTVAGTGTDNQASNVTNNGTESGNVVWTPSEAGTYYYQCSAHAGMVGTITIVSNSNLSGNIDTDTTWELSGSPYTVTGNVLVANGVTLTIEAGVTVKVNSGLYIKIQGSLIAIGTESNKITITSNESSPAKGDWDKIWLASTSTSFDGSDNYVSGTIFNHCIISYANEGLRLDDSSFYLVNSELTENNIGINFRKVINSIIDNNNFNNNSSGTSTSAGTEDNGVGSFTYTKFLNNTFKNNTGHGLSFGGV